MSRKDWYEEGRRFNQRTNHKPLGCLVLVLTFLAGIAVGAVLNLPYCVAP